MESFQSSAPVLHSFQALVRISKAVSLENVQPQPAEVIRVKNGMWGRAVAWAKMKLSVSPQEKDQQARAVLAVSIRKSSGIFLAGNALKLGGFDANSDKPLHGKRGGCPIRLERLQSRYLIKCMRRRIR